jgi:crotonobetaine/carnitine-CoA ligase
VIDPRPAHPEAPDIIAVVAEACSSEPETPALIFEDGVTITRARLRQEVESFAGFLSKRVNPGDRVAIMLENRAEFMVAWLAVVLNGAILVSINTTAGEYDAGHILRDSGAVTVVVSQATEALVRAIQPQCPDLREILLVRDPEPDGLARYAADAEPMDLSETPVDPHAATNIYYTSGTTGPPKGCVLGHDWWLRFSGLYLLLYGMTPSDRLLCCLQFFYGDPPWQLLMSLQAGTTLVVMRRFSVSRFWDVVREHRVTRLFSIASIPTLLSRAPAGERDHDHNMQFALHLGITAATHRDLNARWGFPWIEGYGLTETGLVVAMPLDRAEEMVGSGSIGVPCPDVEIRICRDDGTEAQDDESGEITLRAPGLMQRYWNRPDETAEVTRGGWFYTGDVGRRDERGFLYFVGRKKDIIRRSGENVAAAEVEEVLRSHPAILEAAVVPVPDELRGEEIKAYIALVEHATPETLAPREIVQFCQQRLAKHKVPRYIEYRSEPFPRTPSMRVKKSDLPRVVVAPSATVWDRTTELGW